jgi:hypothetical protein
LSLTILGILLTFFASFFRSQLLHSNISGDCFRASQHDDDGQSLGVEQFPVIRWFDMLMTASGLSSLRYGLMGSVEAEARLNFSPTEW